MPATEKPKKTLKKNVGRPATAKKKQPKNKPNPSKKKPFKLIALISAAIIVAILAFFLIYHLTKLKALAEFNGGKVTRGEFVNVLKTETGKHDPIVWQNAETSLKIKKKILNNLINEKILLHQADKQGIQVSDEELKIELDSFKSGYTEKTFRKMLKLRGITYDDWVQRKRDKYIAQKLIKTDVIDKIEIDQRAINKYYKDHAKEFAHAEQVRARQILVSRWEEAEQIQKELKEGGNFAAIAKKKSISPDRWKGGDLGYFSRGSHPDIFDRVCFNTPVGDTSRIIRSEYGYHIFKVLDKRGPAKENIRQVQPFIVTQLQQQQSEEAFDKWFKPIYDASSVKINNDLLEQIEVTSNDNESKNK